MTAKEYNFIHLSSFSPEMGRDVRNFVSSLGKHVKRECKILFSILDIDISKIMIYDPQVEKDKKKNRDDRLSKKVKLVEYKPEQRQGKVTSPFPEEIFWLCTIISKCTHDK